MSGRKARWAASTTCSFFIKFSLFWHSWIPICGLSFGCITIRLHTCPSGGSIRINFSFKHARIYHGNLKVKKISTPPISDVGAFDIFKLGTSSSSLLLHEVLTMDARGDRIPPLGKKQESTRRLKRRSGWGCEHRCAGDGDHYKERTDDKAFRVCGWDSAKCLPFCPTSYL